MLRPILAWTLLLPVLAACSEEFLVSVAQHGSEIYFDVTAPRDACPRSVRVMTDADQRASVWYISNPEGGRRCIRRFAYGKVPKGWSVIVAARPLAPGTVYRVEIEQPSGSGSETFTPAR